MHGNTDGSKGPSLGRTAAARCIPDIRVVRAFRLTNHLSVFSTELFAIVLAPEWIIEFNPLSVVFLSDSLSTLKVLESLQDGCRNNLVLEVWHLVNIAKWRGLVVDLCWIRAHVGIGGNEACNLAAKHALKLENITQIPLGPSEIFSWAKDQIEKKMAISVGLQYEGTILSQGASGCGTSS